MFTRFEITNFRGFEHLAIESLTRVNLIAGKNNVGKTALLEALFLHIGAHNPELPLKVNAIRGIERVPIQSELAWGWLFNDKRTGNAITLDSTDEKDTRRTLTIKLVAADVVSTSGDGNGSEGRSAGIFSTADISRDLVLEYDDSGRRHAEARVSISSEGEIRFRRGDGVPSAPGFYLGAMARLTGEDAERFSNLERIGKADSLLPTLRMLEPRLTRLAVLVTAGQPMIHGYVGLREPMPLPVMGQGLVRLSAILLALPSVSGGTLLVDEIENGLHHSVLPEVFKAIGEAARTYDVQVFATTHSWECIQAAHQAFSSGPVYDFRLHRLERIKDRIKDVVLDAETLGIALQAELEVR